MRMPYTMLGGLIVLAVVPVAMLVDPALGGFMLWAAIVIFGLGYLSARTSPLVNTAMVILAVLVGGVLYHWTSIGFQIPSVESAKGVLTILAVPLGFAVLCALIRLLRREL